MSRKALAIVFSMAWLGLASQAKANPIADVSAGGSFGPWSVAADSVDAVGPGDRKQPPVGQSVDPDGNSAARIGQPFAAAAGTYERQFSLSGNPALPEILSYPLTKEVSAPAGGASQDYFDTLPANAGFSNMTYLPELLTFATGGGPVTRSFTGLDGPPGTEGYDYRPAVGDVSVSSAVPEPSTWIMMLIGFAGLVFAGYWGRGSAPRLLSSPDLVDPSTPRVARAPRLRMKAELSAPPMTSPGVSKKTFEAPAPTSGSL